MRILICHERFLFRFGADRVLLLLARGLSQLGHEVMLAGNRFDELSADAFSDRTIEVPGDLGPYLDLNESTEAWLRASWRRLFPENANPDVVLVGGWPFITAIPFFRSVAKHVLFIDFGVVPLDGFGEGQVITLSKLKRLRAENLPRSSLVVGISDFIVQSQSRFDAGGTAPFRSVLLGADHVKPSPPSHGPAIELVRSLKTAGKRAILCLGRWEPGCYKNSQAAFDVLKGIGETEPGCCLLILDKSEGVQIPEDLRDRVFVLGFPDDLELAEIMQACDFGVSMSLWEGFNLPLAEMQQLGKSALVFDVGAHPEVAAHPWFLCRDEGEMVQKAIALLRGKGLDAAVLSQALVRFREKFTWQRFAGDYAAILEKLDLPRDIDVIVDVTNSTRDPANSGVIRVTRRICRELQEYLHPVFVVWDAAKGSYVLPTQVEHAQLSAFNGPVIDPRLPLSKGHTDRIALDEVLPELRARDRWLFLPETMIETEFVRVRFFAKESHLAVAAIFYDAIPVLRPDLCNDEMRNNHAAYMRGLAECDLAIPISQYSADCLQDFWTANRVTARCRIDANLLPGEFAGAKRTTKIDRTDPGAQVKILCVSTLEPRKNHKGLIAACLAMEQRHPELDWSLTMIGNRYAGAFDIAEWVEEVAERNPHFRWLGIVDDDTLDRCYRECSFTVYASTIEGFGLPIMESVWHGRPCICHNQGVMAELAEEGGCLTVNVADADDLASAIYRLATDTGLGHSLTSEAVSRGMKTWDDYAKGVLKRLGSVHPSQPALPTSRPILQRSSRWDEVLYENCLREHWQMNDSERMAITGLLARLQPACSIELGTYEGGSLSLLSQFSDMVFSIDIDPSVPLKFGHFDNASFLTGDSGRIVPHLLSELDRANIAVEFILIDADHSAAGVRRDITSVLSYKPTKPLFVMLHDSFNPECRRGMLEADWNGSPYCHWVDLDFVPGRIVENGGSANGELWGGLAVAYFHPAPRKEPLTIQMSARQMFHVLSGAKEREKINLLGRS